MSDDQGFSRRSALRTAGAAGAGLGIGALGTPAEAAQGDAPPRGRVRAPRHRHAGAAR